MVKTLVNIQNSLLFYLQSKVARIIEIVVYYDIYGMDACILHESMPLPF
jgi:hypothetical protein